MKSIDERIKNLPPALKREVEEFVNSLLKKRRKKTRPEAEISEAEHTRILSALEAVSALSLEKGPPVTNRDHDRYLYGGQ